MLKKSVVILLAVKHTNIILCLAATSSNGNGEFGDWSAFSGNPPDLSSSGPSQSVTDLFGSTQATPAQAAKRGPVPPSAELFDLMGGINHQLTNPHTTLSASQSMTFSLGAVAPGASVAMPTMPLSRSQQVNLERHFILTHQNSIKSQKH